MNTKALFFYLLFSGIFCHIQLFAQNLRYDHSKEIDVQVWEPFKIAFDNNDANTFISLHSDDILRITKWEIRKGADFKERILSSMGKENAIPRKIEFKFEHRIYSKDIAYEVGYYKITMNKDSESPKDVYGRFHIVLKRLDGVWKICQDWDVAEINGEKIGPKDYERL
ncbi:YybH family protein [Flagellimonas meishanensis]|uniref:YybH family protein n=1 Tax=Flagellimonas meishanensis TaxID=2873264 RepID=UPI001CA6B477|nr:nuclear transport factor 2 family protein [[Muricauda] meishanensis]